MNLRGMFGSAARQITPFIGDENVPAMAPASAQPAATVPARKPFFTPERRENWAAKAYDVGAIMQGQNPTRVAEMESRRAEEAEKAQQQQQMEQLRGLAAEMFPDNPRAQLLFALDPKAFGGALAEGLKPQTRESGKVYVDPMTGARESMARIDRFDDRYGFIDPETGQAGFSQARGPTFQEGTARAAQEVAARLGQGNLDVARGNLGLREREFNRGPSTGGGGAGGGFWEPF